MMRDQGHPPRKKHSVCAVRKRGTLDTSLYTVLMISIDLHVVHVRLASRGLPCSCLEDLSSVVLASHAHCSPSSISMVCTCVSHAHPSSKSSTPCRAASHCIARSSST